MTPIIQYNNHRKIFPSGAAERLQADATNRQSDVAY